MKIYAITLSFLLGTSVLTAGPCAQKTCKGCAALPDSNAPVILSASAEEALLFQIDEERMAGELYRAFGKQWSARPFKNIPRAEDRHHALLLGLAARAGLSPVGATTAGRFEMAAVQTRYDNLLASGEASLISAFKAGALLEEQDIADLQTLVAATDNEDLKSVATILEAGSRNHLRAFVRNLRSRGIEYAPQILPEDEFDRIIGAGR